MASHAAVISSAVSRVKMPTGSAPRSEMAVTIALAASRSTERLYPSDMMNPMKSAPFSPAIVASSGVVTPQIFTSVPVVVSALPLPARASVLPPLGGPRDSGRGARRRSLADLSLLVWLELAFPLEAPGQARLPAAPALDAARAPERKRRIASLIDSARSKAVLEDAAHTGCEGARSSPPRLGRSVLFGYGWEDLLSKPDLLSLPDLYKVSNKALSAFDTRNRLSAQDAFST